MINQLASRKLIKYPSVSEPNAIMNTIEQDLSTDASACDRIMNCHRTMTRNVRKVIEVILKQRVSQLAQDEDTIVPQ